MCVRWSSRSPHPTTFCHMVWCAALLLLCAALAHADRPRRAEMSPVPFVMGSRYGRSPERVMSPRNDRFFMGSRYGKRSGVEGRLETREVWQGCEGGVHAPCRLLCRYSGMPNLYKCVRAQQHLLYNRRSDVDSRNTAAAGGDE